MSGAQSHQTDGITATSTPASSSGRSSCPNAPQISTTPRVSRARSSAANRSGTSPWMRTRIGASVRWAASISRLGPFCGSADPKNPTTSSSPTRPGLRSRPSASQIAPSSGIAWGTTSIASAGKPAPTSVARIASDTARQTSTPRPKRPRISLSRRR